MKRISIMVAVFVLLARIAAGGEAYREIALTDGRVLHDAEIKSDQPASVTILCKEGLLSIAKRSLPPELAAKHPVRAVEDSASPPPRLPPASRPLPRGPAGTISPAGCRIVSLQDKNGIADVALENDTDHPIRIRVRDLVCRTSSGQSFTARYVTCVAAGRSPDDPSAPTTLVPGYAHFELPGRSATTVRVTFFEPDLNAPKLIESVVWANAR
ncbi:MAG TPA: hypothetical protein VLW52_14485 [Opitutaceae bacterium]|nr:hypothetical protein [Opitutaceae bacterium]